MRTHKSPPTTTRKPTCKKVLRKRLWEVFAHSTLKRWIFWHRKDRKPTFNKWSKKWCNKICHNFSSNRISRVELPLKMTSCPSSPTTFPSQQLKRPKIGSCSYKWTHNFSNSSNSQEASRRLSLKITCGNRHPSWEESLFNAKLNRCLSPSSSLKWNHMFCQANSNNSSKWKSQQLCQVVGCHNSVSVRIHLKVESKWVGQFTHNNLGREDEKFILFINSI